MRQRQADAGERDDRPTTVEQQELARLRAENAELRRANEILKAASAFSPGSSTGPVRGDATLSEAAADLRSLGDLGYQGAVDTITVAFPGHAATH